MTARLLHDTGCTLGEGPLWACDRLWVFDIIGQRLHAMDETGAHHDTWDLGCHASAAGRVAGDRLLIATETALEVFTPATGTREHLVALEADTPATRSNDGRADWQGGFWIGTMGKAAEPGAGAIYRYHKGVLRKLMGGVTIPNALCFSPDGRHAYFTDTGTRLIRRWTLDDAGWPVGAPEPFYQLEASEPGSPDGAIVDAEGALWCALWGGHKVLCIGADGIAIGHIDVPVSRPTCPAAGPGGRLFITTARQGMTADALAAEPHAGGIFVDEMPTDGLEEPEVLLP